jgi:hypothetical protein
LSIFENKEFIINDFGHLKVFYADEELIWNFNSFLLIKRLFGLKCFLIEREFVHFIFDILKIECLFVFSMFFY